MSKYTYQANQMWQRYSEAKINNPANASVKIVFYEENVYNLAGQLVGQPLTSCTAHIEQAAEIPVVDVVTNQPTGETITHAKLMQYLHSLYIQTATDRDNQSLGMFNTTNQQ